MATNSTPVDNRLPESFASSECPICKELLQLPTTLWCGHSLCSACANGLRARNGNAIACPVCRKRTDLGTEVLKVNVGFQDLIERTRLLHERDACSGCRQQLSNDDLYVFPTADTGPVARCYECACAGQFVGPLLLLSQYKTNRASLEQIKNRLEPFEEEFYVWTKQIQKAKSIIEQRLLAVDIQACGVREEFLRIKNDLAATTVPTKPDQSKLFKNDLAGYRMSMDRFVDLHADAKRNVDNLTDIAQNLDRLLRDGWRVSQSASEESAPPLESPGQSQGASSDLFDQQHPPSTISGTESQEDQTSPPPIATAQRPNSAYVNMV